MFLFLHGLAFMFSLFMGVDADSGFSVHSAGGGGAIASPADGGGNMPGH
jgi:hypothetical protein